MSTDEEFHGAEFHEVSFIDQNGELKTTKIHVVQELARQGLMNDHFPKKFIAFQPTTMGNHPTSIDTHLPVSPPTIDIAKLQSDASRELELRRLAEAAKEWGSFLITNHGLEDMVLGDAKDAIKGFFGLSFEEKKANVGSYKSVDNMGYGKSFVKSEDQTLDWTDRLTMKAAPVDPDEATNGLMIWPKNPVNFRQVIETYVEKSRKVLDGLLQDLAASLSLDENAFLQYFEPKQSEIKVRVNYYPPCPRPDLAIGILPHSDASCLTLLLEFGATSALQVLKDKLWTTLQWPNDNSLLVNIGDLLEIMSNGVFKSPWHRVRAQADVERFSLAYFYNPPAKSEIGPEVGGDSTKVTYKKVVVEDYVSNFYKISPRPSKEAIMYAKIT